LTSLKEAGRGHPCRTLWVKVAERAAGPFESLRGEIDHVFDDFARSAPRLARAGSNGRR
jgi:hypothetical protein